MPLQHETHEPLIASVAVNQRTEADTEESLSTARHHRLDQLVRPGTGARGRSHGPGQKTCDAVLSDLSEVDPFEWGFTMAGQIGDG